MQEIEISKGIKRIQFDSFDSWLNARHGIGGSDASAVLGLNPYKTNIELYLEKTGQRMAPDISDKDYVKMRSHCLDRCLHWIIQSIRLSTSETT